MSGKTHNNNHRRLRMMPHISSISKVKNIVFSVQGLEPCTCLSWSFMMSAMAQIVTEVKLDEGEKGEKWQEKPTFADGLPGYFSYLEFVLLQSYEVNFLQDHQAQVCQINFLPFQSLPPTPLFSLYINNLGLTLTSTSLYVVLLHPKLAGHCYLCTISIASFDILMAETNGDATTTNGK